MSLPPTPFPVVPALTKALNIRSYWLTETVYNPQTFARAKKYVYERIEGGHFRPRIAKTFRFEDVVKAYQYLESNLQIGKVLLTVRA